MAYSSWSVVAGEQPSASKWNILGTNDSSFNDGTGIANLEIGSGHTSLKNDYKFSVYRNGAWTGAASATLVQFDTKTFDTGSNVDVVTNKGRFTAPIAGFYFFSSTVGFANVAGGNFLQMYLYKNGSLALSGLGFVQGTTAGFTAQPIISGFLQLVANDYIEVYAYNGAVTAGGTGVTSNDFQGFLVSTT